MNIMPILSIAIPALHTTLIRKRHLLVPQCSILTVILIAIHVTIAQCCQLLYLSPTGRPRKQYIQD
jgi:hypothetical protein